MFKSENTLATNFILMSIDNFQSLIQNANIPKLSMKFKFQSKYVRKTFITTYKIKKDQEEEIIIQSNQQQNEEKDQFQESSIMGFQSKQNSESIMNKNYFDLKVCFQLSIILKQYYQEYFDKISSLTNSQILLIPGKIKFSSQLLGDLELAVGEVDLLIKKLEIHQVHFQAEEIYFSRFYQKKLHPIKIEEILGKYYIWFDRTIIKKQKVQQLKYQIFDNSSHCFYQFLVSETNFHNRQIQQSLEKYGKFTYCFNQIHSKRKKSRNLTKSQKMFMELKQKLFEDLFQKLLNNQRTQEKLIEVSKDGWALLIHCQIREQLLMQISAIQELYKKYNYIGFFYKDKDSFQPNNPINDKIEKVCNYLKQFNFLSYLAEDKAIWITYQVSKLRIKQHSNIFLNVSKLLQFQCQIEQIKTRDENIKNYPNLVVKNVGWLVNICLQMKGQSNYKDLFDWILNQKKQITTSEPSNYQKQPKVVLQVVENVINISHGIEDSTLLDISLNNDENNFKEKASTQILKKSTLRQRLNIYKVLINDSEGLNKYQNIKEFRKVIGKRCPEFEQNLKQITKTIQYKSYKVKIPQQLKVQLMGTQFHPIVTVFAKEDEKTKIYKTDKIRVFLISSTNHLRTDGYLLNVNKTKIIQPKPNYLEISQGTYELIKVLRYVDG